MQNLDDAAFQQSMLDKYGTVEMKRAALEQSAIKKRTSIQPEIQAQLDYVEDADTFALKGQANDSRLTGYDAYETFHNGQLQDPTIQSNGKTRGENTRARLDRQKARYSREFGKPYNQVTDNDIYKQGAREGLMALHETVKQPGDAPWTPGPLSEDWYTAKGGQNPAQMGSRETPLGINVNVAQNGVDKFGRNLTQAYNPTTGQNINEAMTNANNAAVYSNNRFDKSATQNRRQSLAEGVNLANMTPAERYAHEINNGGAPGEDGRTWSNIKGIAAGGANIVKNVMDLASEGAAAAAEMSGAMSPKYAQKVKDYHNSTLEQWQKKLGVNTRYSQEATQELNTAVEEGRYLDALGSVVGNLDVHLSNSAPEMIALSAKLPGLAVAVNSRTKEQTEAFKKAEGREPTSAETAMMVVTNTAVLGAEQLVLIGPLKSVFKSATQSGRTVGKTSRDKVMSVMRTTLGETAQEALDQTQEQYWSKGGSGQAEGKEAFTEAGRKLAAGEIITPNEAIAAGIAGAGMGGALRTAAETVSAPRDILNAQKSQGERDAGEYLVGDEKELGEAFDEMSHADVKKGKEEAVDAAAKIDEMNSIEEGLKSENPLIKRAAENFIKETNDADVGVEEGSDRHIDNIGLLTRDAVLDTENEGAQGLVQFMQDSLGIDIIKAKAEQIADAIYALDTDARKAITDAVTTEMSNRTSDQKIDEKGGFNKFKEQLKDTIALQDKVATVKTKEWEIAGKNVKEGAKKAPKTLKEGRVNVKKVAKDTRRGKLGTLVDIVTLNNRAATAAKKELNTYTDEALVEAYKNPDASKSLKKYISQVRDKRKEAKKRSGIDKGSYGPRELKNQLLEGDKASYLAAIKKGLAPTSYGDKRDVVAMRGILDTALNSEFITERQSEIFNKRLDKIGAKAQDPDKKVLDAEAKAESKAEEETGLGEQGKKNRKSPELTRSGLEKEKAEIQNTVQEFVKSKDGKEFERIGFIEEKDRTKEESKFFKEQKDKQEKMLARMKDVQSKLKNYSQHELDMNDAHSSMDEDWFFSGTKPVNASEAFSQEEKDILGIC